MDAKVIPWIRGIENYLYLKYEDFFILKRQGDRVATKILSEKGAP